MSKIETLDLMLSIYLSIDLKQINYWNEKVPHTDYTFFCVFLHAKNAHGSLSVVVYYVVSYAFKLGQH